VQEGENWNSHRTPSSIQTNGTAVVPHLHVQAEVQLAVAQLAGEGEAVVLTAHCRQGRVRGSGGAVRQREGSAVGNEQWVGPGCLGCVHPGALASLHPMHQHNTDTHLCPPRMQPARHRCRGARALGRRAETAPHATAAAQGWRVRAKHQPASFDQAAGARMTVLMLLQTAAN